MRECNEEAEQCRIAVEVLNSMKLTSTHSYFRAPVLLGLVWILWGLNVFIFRQFRINYVDLMNFDPQTTLTSRQIILSGFGFVCFVGVLTLGFTYQIPFNDVLLFPSMLYITMAFCLVAPVNVLHRPGRERLLHNLARVMFPASTGVLFVEVLLGDVLTSISKVLADVEVTGCVLAAHMVTPRSVELEAHDPSEMKTSYSFHEAECADSWMRPLVTSIPFLLRFRQCWVQYRVTGKAFPNLMNCAKYLSSLPVIWISAFTQQEGHFSRELRAAWIFAVSFNSFFSFMWDIVMDWGLCRQGARHFLLREHLIFDTCGGGAAAAGVGGAAAGDFDLIGKRGGLEGKRFNGATSTGHNHHVPEEDEFEMLVRQATTMNGEKSSSLSNAATMNGSSSFNPLLVVFHWILSLLPCTATGGGHTVYYIAIGLNFVLRILWSFKLSVHFQLSQEGMTFVLEVCEVFRRFIWILFRVEWEAVDRNAQALQGAAATSMGGGVGRSMQPSMVGNLVVGGNAVTSLGERNLSFGNNNLGVLVIDEKQQHDKKSSPKSLHAALNRSVVGGAKRSNAAVTD